MMQQIKDLIHNNAFCVLATCFEDKPHCSLMSYAADADCRELYMITLSDTRKFRNISMNPMVSLLIDSRADRASGETHTIQALTLGGRIQSVTDPDKKEQARQILLKAHPELKDFTGDAEAVFLCMQIESEIGRAHV
jgi:nitroimidazol reductase NimA-like FMN-containing flavoprotein (pyridoxamine 5'-phosphate oxidase superfamily)